MRNRSPNFTLVAMPAVLAGMALLAGCSPAVETGRRPQDIRLELAPNWKAVDHRTGGRPGRKGESLPRSRLKAWLQPAGLLTSRDLPKTRDTIEFYSGDLSQFVNERLKPSFRSIWFVGGGVVSGECLRLGLADEVRYSIMPVLIGEGISFFDGLAHDVVLHLVEVKAYKSGMVALCHEVRK